MQNTGTNISHKTYTTWSNEYLKEAENLKRRVNLLREKARTEYSRDEAEHFLWRASMLYGMYLDCLHNGRLLRERSRQLNENSAATQPENALRLIQKSEPCKAGNRDGAA